MYEDRDELLLNKNYERLDYRNRGHGHGSGLLAWRLPVHWNVSLDPRPPILILTLSSKVKAILGGIKVAYGIRFPNRLFPWNQIVWFHGDVPLVSVLFVPVSHTW